MKKALLVECSPHGRESLGTQVARGFLQRIAGRISGLRITTRSLVAPGLPPLPEAYASGIIGAYPSDASAFSLSETLISEIEASDFVLVSTPMHNFTVPAALKLWIDYVTRIGRTFKATNEGKSGLLQDRPTVVLVRSGGVCAGESARQPDFLTPYLRQVLATIGLGSVDFLYLPGLTPDARAVAAIQEQLDALPAVANLIGETA